MKEATKAGIQSNKRLVSTGGANQGVRRSSRRIASAPRLASAASLFVNEHEAESESSDEDNGASPETSAETSSVEHATMVAAVGTSFENASSLGESPIPDLHRAELVEAGHTFEPGTSPSMLCAAAVVNHQYEHTASQSAPALSLSNAQPYQSPFNTTYGVVEGLSHGQQQAGIESPPRASSNGLHQGLAEQDASISQAREMHLQVGDEEELGMHDAASPQFFNDAFEDLFGSSLQNESEMNFTDTSVGYIDVGEAAVGYMDVEEAAVGYMDVEEAIVDCQEEHAADRHHTQSFAQDPIFQSYLDFACRLNFQLPHETPEHTDQVEVRELLSPLVEGTPLTSKLLHGLIYLLVPGPLRVLELDSGVCDGELLPNESLVDNFALIFSQSTNGLCLLVLGDAEKKTLLVLSSRPANLPAMNTLHPKISEWRTKHIDPYEVAPYVESSLLSVWIAEAYFCQRPLTNVPSSRCLRLRFLGELLAPSQRDFILGKWGISSKLAASQQVDTRSVMAHTEIQAQENDIFVANLEGFDSDALHKVLCQRPAEIPRGRCLRILQCVHEIGCPYILESLKLAFTQKHEGHSQEAVQQPIVEKLFHIHLYLDRQETQNHLLVARSRYVKYCYFETYLLAVEALRKEKRDGTRENKKISALKKTTSFKLGLCNELPPTPHSDEIHRIYEDFSPVEKKRRAEDMVKNEISKKVAKVYRVEEKCIRRDINRYIREGRVLHYILQGGVVLNPSLLLLFPSFGTNPPSLSTARLGIELKEAEEKSLNKPIEVKDIERLTKAEAIWFGKVLQARPGLLEVVPKTILDLISDSPTEALDLHELDANRFRDRPLSFFVG
ncbi:hypothetical protein ACJBU6_08368 [Exserohilum turcicum]